MERSALRKPRTAAAKRAPRARLDVDERRAQLLGLGLAIFSERSYDEVSIDDLARAAGVSKGLLYHYFPTKHDLYVAALAHAAAQLLEVTTTDRSGTPAERLARGLSTYLSFVERHGKAYVALMHGGIGSDTAVAAMLERTRATFAARILEDMQTETARPLLRTALRGWIGFVEATALDWFAHREVSRDELVALLAGVLFDAVARASGVRLEGIGAVAEGAATSANHEAAVSASKPRSTEARAATRSRK
jgi:AcrR family transcriptional regulator